MADKTVVLKVLQRYHGSYAQTVRLRLESDKMDEAKLIARLRETWKLALADSKPAPPPRPRTEAETELLIAPQMIPFDVLTS